MNKTNMKNRNCFCYKCGRLFFPLGIARHRAMHRDKKETVAIQYADNSIVNHLFAKKQEAK